MDDVEKSLDIQGAPETHQEVAETQPKVEVEDSNERNFRQIREHNKELLRELKAQREINEKILAAQMPKEVDELDEIEDDAYLSKGQVKKFVMKEAQRIGQQAAQAEAERLLKQRESYQFRDRLKSQFSDFDEVVNQETLAILEQQDPDLAMTIAELKDPYKIGLQSYKYIKALNISDKVPQKRRLKEVEDKLDKNSKTIQTPQAYDKRPMAQAFKMTESEKSALYKEMIECAGQAGFSY